MYSSFRIPVYPTATCHSCLTCPLPLLLPLFFFFAEHHHLHGKCQLVSEHLCQVREVVMMDQELIPTCTPLLVLLCVQSFGISFCDSSTHLTFFLLLHSADLGIRQRNCGTFGRRHPMVRMCYGPSLCTTHSKLTACFLMVL